MTQAESSSAEADFAAFQAWKASQGQSQGVSVPTPDEVPDVTIADVLCALVRSARLPDETTVLKYEGVIRSHFPDPSASDAEAAEG